MRRGTEHFPRVPKSMDELPGPVAAAVRQHRPDAALEDIVFIPPQDYAAMDQGWGISFPFRWRRTPQHTLIFGDDQATLLAVTPDTPLAVTTIPRSAVVEMRFVTILLYGYVEVAWLDAGQIARTHVEFNEVGGPNIQQGLNRMRAAIPAGTTPDAASSPPTVSTQHFPLKFQNFTRNSLLPGEQLLTAVYQPATRKLKQHPRKQKRLFGAPLAPNRVFAITDRHLILIEDTLARGRNPYKVDRHFFPRDKVQRVTFEPDLDAVWMRLTIGSSTASEEMLLPLHETNTAELRARFDTWLRHSAAV